MSALNPESKFSPPPKPVSRPLQLATPKPPSWNFEEKQIARLVSDDTQDFELAKLLVTHVLEQGNP